MTIARTWATRNDDGDRHIWLGKKPVMADDWIDARGQWWRGERSFMTDILWTQQFNAIFPHGIKRGECKQIKLQRAIIVEEA